jgi:hypothetical protein
MHSLGLKFKMVATAVLSLTLDPIGKMFQNASSLKPLGQLKPNCPGMIIGRSSVFYGDRKSKMAATTGHSILIPEAFKSLYRSPGYKKTQLVLCKNYVLQW